MDSVLLGSIYYPDIQLFFQYEERDFFFRGRGESVRVDQRSNSHTRPLSELGFCLHFNHNQQL